MNTKLMRLAERRAHLLAQIAAQRMNLAQNIEPWRRPLARADQGLAVLRYCKHHPVLIIGIVTVLAAWWPKPASQWLRRGWVAWQIVHKLRSR